MLFGDRRLAGLADRLGEGEPARAGAGPPRLPGYVYAGLAVIVGIYFLSAPTQNLRSFLTTLVIAGLAAFGIHELRKQAHEEIPGRQLRRDLRQRQGTAWSAPSRAPTSASGPRNCACRRCAGPRPAAAPADDEDARLARLERLGELHEKGVLSDEEFAAEKAKVLGDEDKSS